MSPKNLWMQRLDSKPKNTLPLKEVPPATMKERLSWEKELLGLYISGHPLDEYELQIKKAGSTIEKVLKTATPEVKERWKQKVQKSLLVVHIDTVKVILTKSNSKMAFVQVQDKSGIAEAVVFPETYKKIGASLIEGAVVAIQCSATNRDERKSLLIDNIKVLS